MKEKNKKGQFYLIATIIIVGLIIGLAVTFNYSARDNSYKAEEIANELKIEGENVIDYDTMHSTDKFDNFSKEYSSYVGTDKEIYYIIVEGNDKEAYKYTNGVKEDFNSDLSVTENNIQFNIKNEIYNFDFRDGKNFYFVVIHETGGERYVFSG